MINYYESTYHEKELPLQLKIVLSSIIDENKDYANEILEFVAYQCVSYNPDTSAMFLMDFIKRLTKAVLNKKNEEIGDLNNIANFCCVANNVLHRKYVRKIDSSSRHIALHTLSYMYKGTCPEYLRKENWSKKYCQDLYEYYKGKNLDDVVNEHHTYQENKYIVPFLKELVANWESRGE